MEKIDLITILISIISLIVPLFGTIHSLYKSKDEYIKLKLEKKQLRESISFINNNSALSISEVDSDCFTKDDYKITLYWYCYSVADKLTELYPKCYFSISIKLVTKDTVSTILTTGAELFIDDSVQQVKDNIEYEAILKDGFDYFFVTDLHTFDEKKQRYITSDSDWRYKYNTSIVFPIKSRNDDENKIIGFICINSPQILRKKKKNDLIIKLIEDTSENIGKILPNF